MGKPAATVGMPTTHGGVVVGPGVPNVLIGGMPAAVVGDTQICPLFNPGLPPPPHVGGPVALGSPLVLIGGKPAARMGDLAICCGPPTTIAMGNPMVLIGESASGGTGAPGLGLGLALPSIPTAGGAAVGTPSTPASLDAIRGVCAASSQNPAPLIENNSLVSATQPAPNSTPSPPQPDDPPLGNHWIEFKFVDSAGLPVSGVPYSFQDMDGNTDKGLTPWDGRILRRGFENSGTCKMALSALSNPKWSKNKARVGDIVEISVDVHGYEDGTKAVINIFEKDNDRRDDLIKRIETEVQNGKIQDQWTYEYIENNDNITVKDRKKGYSAPEYYFVVEIKEETANSDLLELQDWIEFDLISEDGRPYPNEDYILTLPDGKVVKGKLDANGHARVENVRPGKCTVKFPGIQPDTMPAGPPPENTPKMDSQTHSTAIGNATNIPTTLKKPDEEKQFIEKMKLVYKDAPNVILNQRFVIYWQYNEDGVSIDPDCIGYNQTDDKGNFALESKISGYNWHATPENAVIECSRKNIAYTSEKRKLPKGFINNQKVGFAIFPIDRLEEFTTINLLDLPEFATWTGTLEKGDETNTPEIKIYCTLPEWGKRIDLKTDALARATKEFLEARTKYQKIFEKEFELLEKIKKMETIVKLSMQFPMSETEYNFRKGHHSTTKYLYKKKSPIREEFEYSLEKEKERAAEKAEEEKKKRLKDYLDELKELEDNYKKEKNYLLSTNDQDGAKFADKMHSLKRQQKTKEYIFSQKSEKDKILNIIEHLKEKIEKKIGEKTKQNEELETELKAKKGHYLSLAQDLWRVLNSRDFLYELEQYVTPILNSDQGSLTKGPYTEKELGWLKLFNRSVFDAYQELARTELRDEIFRAHILPFINTKPQENGHLKIVLDYWYALVTKKQLAHDDLSPEQFKNLVFGIFERNLATQAITLEHQAAGAFLNKFKLIATTLKVDSIIVKDLNDYLNLKGSKKLIKINKGFLKFFFDVLDLKSKHDGINSSLKGRLTAVDFVSSALGDKGNKYLKLMVGKKIPPHIRKAIDYRALKPLRWIGPSLDLISANESFEVDDYHNATFSLCKAVSGTMMFGPPPLQIIGVGLGGFISFCEAMNESLSTPLEMYLTSLLSDIEAKGKLDNIEQVEALVSKIKKVMNKQSHHSWVLQRNAVWPLNSFNIDKQIISKWTCLTIEEVNDSIERGFHRHGE